MKGVKLEKRLYDSKVCSQFFAQECQKVIKELSWKPKNQNEEIWFPNFFKYDCSKCHNVNYLVFEIGKKYCL